MEKGSPSQRDQTLVTENRDGRGNWEREGTARRVGHLRRRRGLPHRRGTRAARGRPETLLYTQAALANVARASIRKANVFKAGAHLCIYCRSWPHTHTRV